MVVLVQLLHRRRRDHRRNFQAKGEGNNLPRNNNNNRALEIRAVCRSGILPPPLRPQRVRLVRGNQSRHHKRKALAVAC